MIKEEADLISKNIIVETVKGLLYLSKLNPGIDGGLDGNMVSWLENTTDDDIERIINSINIDGVEKYRRHFKITTRLKISFIAE